MLFIKKYIIMLEGKDNRLDLIQNLKKLILSGNARKSFLSLYLSKHNLFGSVYTLQKDWGTFKGPKKLLCPDIIETTEEPVLNLIKSLDISGICIDVGAWIGYYTILLAKKATKVYALEPDPRNIRFLEENVKANHIENIVILPNALDVKDGKVRLVLAPNSTGNSIYSSGYSLDVNAISLKTIISNVQESEIDLIKMDIETAEFPIIRNSKKEIFKKIKQWMVECHSNNQKELDDIQKIFEDNGYHIKWLKDNNQGKTNHIFAKRI